MFPDITDMGETIGKKGTEAEKDEGPEGDGVRWERMQVQETNHETDSLHNDRRHSRYELS